MSDGLVRGTSPARLNQRTTHVEALVQGQQDGGSIPPASIFGHRPKIKNSETGSQQAASSAVRSPLSTVAWASARATLPPRTTTVAWASARASLPPSTKPVALASHRSQLCRRKHHDRSTDAPWRGDGHPGSSFRTKGECPDESSAHVNPGSDSPHSVRACRQAFAEDLGRPLQPRSASLTQLRSFSGTRWSLHPRPSH